MNNRCSRALLCGAFLSLTGCTSFFPNTAQAVAPATLNDVFFGLLADLDQWMLLLIP